MKVNILGSEWTVERKKYNEDDAFDRKSYDGYCDPYQRKIVYCDMETYPGWDHEEPGTVKEAEKETLRHEIVHAYLDESGLQTCASVQMYSWAKNEEMVDWIALQGPKIYKTWEEVGAL